MIIVTGGAGFIGSNIVKQLNAKGREDIIVVDNLENGHQFQNLVDCKIADYIDKDDFIQMLGEDFEKIEVIFHQGACSTTTEWDGYYMMKNNYEYSKILLHFATDFEIPFIYASSAAIYGGASEFKIDPAYEKPLNVYGYSKLLFDQYVQKMMPVIQSQVVGLRYFNVYGPREQHKDEMASVAFHLNNQLKANGKIKLFGEYDGYAAGEQKRDFVYVDDVVDVNLWFHENKSATGIFNVGTGKAQSFNEVAQAVLDFHQRGELTYVDFPEHLKGAYQSYTQADLTELRAAGYDKSFTDVQTGVKRYLEQL